MRLGMIHIPNPLHIAENGFVYAEKLLELVDEQGEGARGGKFHQVFEDFREAFRFAHDGNP